MSVESREKGVRLWVMRVIEILIRRYGIYSYWV